MSYTPSNECNVSERMEKSQETPANSRSAELNLQETPLPKEQEAVSYNLENEEKDPPQSPLEQKTSNEQKKSSFNLENDERKEQIIPQPPLEQKTSDEQEKIPLNHENEEQKEQIERQEVYEEERENEQDELPVENERVLSEDMRNAELFENASPGDYTYVKTPYGMQAFGQLTLEQESARNAAAQREVGGEDRREDDDGGHLIATRFGGSGELENLSAQNRNLNRGGYKAMENEWARLLGEGNKVFVNVETYQREGVDRPEAYMGYYIVETPDGQRSWEAFSFNNESQQTISEIETEFETQEQEESARSELAETDIHPLPVESPVVRNDLEAEYKDEYGRPNWRSEEYPYGFAQDPPQQRIILPPGRYSRYGGPGGYFLAPLGTPYERLSLPYEYDPEQDNIIELLEPIEVTAGHIQENFGTKSGGIQYMTDKPLCSYKINIYKGGRKQ